MFGLELDSTPYGELHLTGIVALFQAPGVATWWRGERRPSFSPEFVALVEEILGEGAERRGETQG